MEPNPLVGAEVQRIRVAFEAASRELSAALTALSDVHLDDLGTPVSDPAVARGVADLRTTLEHLRSTADDCARVTGRHGGGPATPEAGEG